MLLDSHVFGGLPDEVHHRDGADVRQDDEQDQGPEDQFRVLDEARREDAEGFNQVNQPPEAQQSNQAHDAQGLCVVFAAIDESKHQVVDSGDGNDGQIEVEAPMLAQLRKVVHDAAKHLEVETPHPSRQKSERCPVVFQLHHLIVEDDPQSSFHDVKHVEDHLHQEPDHVVRPEVRGEDVPNHFQLQRELDAQAGRVEDHDDAEGYVELRPSLGPQSDVYVLIHELLFSPAHLPASAVVPVLFQLPRRLLLLPGALGLLLHLLLIHQLVLRADVALVQQRGDRLRSLFHLPRDAVQVGQLCPDPQMQLA
mmetsp:Transcript_28369/g.94171  ORF Transcript_28369/g.94171 Transcript_28369/m.94171 type:complete len:309 (+) Transcript_28369:1913-2839(+)